MINFVNISKITCDLFWNYCSNLHQPYNIKTLTFYVNRASRRKGLTFHTEIEIRAVDFFPFSSEYDLVLK